ncbi:glycosyltransferase family 25 protein [Phenylobacterium sp.]|uniref:glycosyltransferase family 25 protein n=1 Tax=Phenylobacterium sp. TaxID=1871053 RepID=UPI0035AF43C7
MSVDPIRCCVINLPKAAKRLDAIRSAFAAAAPVGWTLEVFPGVDGAQIETQGRLTAGEKGAFLSHLRLLESSLHDDAPLWILEDDAELSASAFQMVGEALSASKAHLLFTDVGPANAEDMLKVLAFWPGRNTPRLLDLRAIQFVGASSYLVAGPAKRELATLLRVFADPLDAPIDLVLRHLIHEGALSAAVTLPFLTTLSPHAEQSQVYGLTVKERVWNTTRRLFFIDQDLEACASAASQLFQELGDRKAQVFGQLLAARVSADFRESGQVKR